MHVCVWLFHLYIYNMCITWSAFPFILGGTNKNMSWGSCCILATWFGWGSGHPKSAWNAVHPMRWYPHGPWPMAALQTTSLSKKNGYILRKYYITVFIYIYIPSLSISWSLRDIILSRCIVPLHSPQNGSYHTASEKGMVPEYWMKTPCAKPLEAYPRGPTSRSMWNINHWSFSERLSPWLFYISKRLPQGVPPLAPTFCMAASKSCSVLA